MDHPGAGEEIEDECSMCHMPMARTQAQGRGEKGAVFAHLPMREAASDRCRARRRRRVVHAVPSDRPDKLGTPESFTGGYVSTPPRPDRARCSVRSRSTGRDAIMHSATGFVPAEAATSGSRRLCATCHTLYTKALGPDGEVVGRLPEQVPYLEWRHSAFVNERSCQSCHMPVVEQTPIASVLGEPREGFARHTFLGGNAFMLADAEPVSRRARRRGPAAGARRVARATMQHLQHETRSVSIERAERARRLRLDIASRT